MKKTLNLSKSIYELTNAYPELTEIMSSLGFTEIKKKIVRKTVGKLMSIERGAQIKGISLSKIKETLREAGFDIIQDETTDKPNPADSSAMRRELIKSYLKRLSSGENLESVRHDFVEAFSDVDAKEIMRAEQELIAEGEPVDKVKKMCDIHSALFHKQKTALQTDTQPANPHILASQAESQKKYLQAAGIAGHPLRTLTLENAALGKLIDKAFEKLGNGESAEKEIEAMRSAAVHYAKKGDLLYPNLSVRYGIDGPSKVMWTVDGELRSGLARAAKDANGKNADINAAVALLKRMKEMIFKEDNILFPICAATFTEEEWKQIYRDSKDYAPCLGVTAETWHDAEEENPAPAGSGNGNAVALDGGAMTAEQLSAVLDTLPAEITFVDDKNINRYFNNSRGPKAFKRPQMALGREVFSCHPPKVQAMVKSMIEELRSGRKDNIPVWLVKNGRHVLVNYMAVRGKNGCYLGTMEVVQDMEEAFRHFTDNQRG